MGIPYEDQASNEQQRHSFGPFTVNLAARRLERDGAPVEIEPKPFDILVILLAHPGQVVTYEDFKVRLWPDVTIEVNKNVNTQVNKLRKALGESSGKPSYVLTKHGEGYYFNPDVAVKAKAPAAEIQQSPVRAHAAAPADVSQRKQGSNGQPAEINGRVHNRRQWQRPVLVLAAVISVVTVCLILAPRVLPRHDPSRVVLYGRTLVMLDQEGRPTWRFELPGNPPDLRDLNNFNNAKPVIADIDGNGQKGLLYAFSDTNKQAGADTLYCFNAHGGVRWTHRMGRELESISSSRVYPNHYVLVWIGVLNRPTPQGGRIIIGGRRGGTSIFGIELLTSQGKVVGEYYHPGWLWAMGLMDLDGDGYEEIILGGVNNAYGMAPGLDHPMTLVVLDSRHVEGEGPAPASDDRHFKSLSSGHERAVLLFRNFGQLPRADDPNDFCLFREIRPEQDRFEAVAINLRDPDLAAHYQFDRNLKLEMVLPKTALAELLDEKNGRSSSQMDRLKRYMQELGDIKVLKNDFAVVRPSTQK